MSKNTSRTQDLRAETFRMMIACKHARQQTLSTIAVDKPTVH